MNTDDFYRNPYTEAVAHIDDWQDIIREAHPEIDEEDEIFEHYIDQLEHVEYISDDRVTEMYDEIEGVRTLRDTDPTMHRCGLVDFDDSLNEGNTVTENGISNHTATLAQLTGYDPEDYLP